MVGRTAVRFCQCASQVLLTCRDTGIKGLPPAASKPAPLNRPAAQCFWRTIMSAAPAGSAGSARTKAAARSNSPGRLSRLYGGPAETTPHTPHSGRCNTAAPPAVGHTAAERCFRCGRRPQNPSSVSRRVPPLPSSRSISTALYPRAAPTGTPTFQPKQSLPPGRALRALFPQPVHRGGLL